MRHRFAPGVLVAIAVGGAVGTLLRVVIAQAIPPATNGFPGDTLSVNLAGSLVLGFVVVAALERGTLSRYFRPLVGTGFCGGLTTFSTFVVEVDLLVRAGHPGMAALYLGVSLIGGLATVGVGMVLARALWSRKAE